MLAWSPEPPHRTPACRSPKPWSAARDTTGPAVVLKALDELRLRAQEVLEQLAGLLNGRLALVGLLDGSAVLQDFVS